MVSRFARGGSDDSHAEAEVVRKEALTGSESCLDSSRKRVHKKVLHVCVCEQ